MHYKYAVILFSPYLFIICSQTACVQSCIHLHIYIHTMRGINLRLLVVSERTLARRKVLSKVYRWNRLRFFYAEVHKHISVRILYYESVRAMRHAVSKCVS